MPEVFVSDESELKGRTVEELWNEEMMTITSKDGKYKAQLEALIAIDMEDTNDPNWKMFPSVEKLKWFNGDYEMNLKVMDWPQSYLLIYKSKVIYNEDTRKYVGDVSFTMTGFVSLDRNKFYDFGVLNKVADVYQNKPFDSSIRILPKKGWTPDELHGLEISLQTPSNSGYKNQNILKIYPPKN
ncbi:hypothetical protein RE628_06355 [Paenibacillus sp. D2_2]|uniref:hypothetical protein n=1 Tax=Paenibacillus sp. D2_2 TaxID=3073092 RepID=UPI0028166CD5|nr:hypothetical protein [Paenibacillus sp. D2_2]WMT42055.1 hypothetical protein RE628_06355 [Paenibacillus sp. D2_2]